MAAPSSPVHATAMGQDFGSEYPRRYPTSAQCAAHDKQNSSRDGHAQLPARKADGGIGLPKNIAAQIQGETGPGGAAKVCFTTHKQIGLASAARMSVWLFLASRFTVVVASPPPKCQARSTNHDTLSTRRLDGETTMHIEQTGQRAGATSGAVTGARDGYGGGIDWTWDMEMYLHNATATAAPRRLRPEGINRPDLPERAM